MAFLSTALSPVPKQVCFVSVGAPARARGRGAACPLYRNQYSPPPAVAPRGGVCVCECVCPRVQTASLHKPCALGRGCLSRLRDPRPLGGTPGRAWLQLRGTPDSANLPGARDRNPRAARSVQGFSASWAASPSAHGAARPPEPGDAWSAPAEAARSPRPGRRVVETTTTRLSLLSPHPCSAPPSQIRTPSPVSPAHLAALFQNPERSEPLPSRARGEEGSEARAMTKLPNLPAVSDSRVLCRLHGPGTQTSEEPDGFKS